ncbi:lipopolysaccharide biosynthesis protein [Flavobacterium sp. CS20]|uniref:lipopolysaccharide biosynthesis protein n=1 Tax=Flavobacterium sp. CS20 TaxID=2775246 RepID=UPI001B3A44C5|nr:lipopolysaccharide biosynthesis protein [Flavobacterium sp. CS20]QTY26674.1 lipopolysaccharide biosynthesis protein [Flavobacterium sp. CS20]
MSKTVSNSKVASSILWVLIEKFGYSILNFISVIILARLLTPYDFGLVGTIAIFISISTMMIESGFGVALVKKKNVTEIDYSTVFIFNLLICSLLYVVIFYGAIPISTFYGEPILKNIIRIMSLMFFFNAFTLTQRVHLIRELKFKIQTYISLISFLFSVVLSIGLALLDFGVWALVAQRLLYTFIYSLLVFIKVRFFPKLIFSFIEFKKLFSFGGRIILSSFLQTAYNDIFALIISKVYSINITGLYTQSQKLISFPLNIFRSIYDGVAFPILSKIDDNEEFSSMCSKISRSVYMLSFPLLLLIPFKADLIIEIVLGEQWIEATPILKILSIAVLILLVEMANLNTLKSFGNAKLYLKVGVIRTIVGFIILGVTINFSLTVLLWGVVLTNLISCLLAIYYVNNSNIYLIKNQLRDIIFPLFVSLIAIIMSKFLVFFSTNYILIDLLIFLSISLILYIFIVYMLKPKEFKLIKILILHSKDKSLTKNE